MRILHFVHGFPPEYTGGTELYVARLAEAESARGHEVAVVSGSGRSRARAEIVFTPGGPSGVGVHRLHRIESVPEAWFRTYSPHAEGMISDLVEKLAPDVLHVHHWKRLTRNIVAIGLRHRVPSVVTLHDLFATCPKDFRLRDGRVCEEPLPNPLCPACIAPRSIAPAAHVAEELELFRAALSREIALAARVLAPSAAHATRVSSLLGLKPRLVETLPLGAIREMEKAARAGAPRGLRPLRVVFFGHMDPVKGPHLLLDAMREVEARGASRLEAHLFGRPVTDEYGALLRAKSEGLPVTFHGAYSPPDLAPFRFDVAVIPSTAAESYSFVLDEAFALGLPVVVSDIGALAERAGNAGRSFRAGDASDLASRLEEILSSPGEVEALRKAIPDRASPPMGEHAEALLDRYAAALESAVPPRPATPADFLPLLRQRVRDVEERRLDLVEAEARAEWLEKSKWSLESYAVSLRTRSEESGKEREALVAEIARLKDAIARLEASHARKPSFARRIAGAIFPKA